MNIDIHPSAADNFNTKADALIKHIGEFQHAVGTNEGFLSEVHMARSLTDKDIVGGIDFTTSDYKGNTIERFFHFNEKTFGLTEDAYRAPLKIPKF